MYIHIYIFIWFFDSKGSKATIHEPLACDELVQAPFIAEKLMPFHCARGGDGRVVARVVASIGGPSEPLTTPGIKQDRRMRAPHRVMNVALHRGSKVRTKATF